MPRPARANAGEYIYHVLRRSAGGLTLFAENDDYAAFEQLLSRTVEHTEMRLLAYCIMSTHWHLVLHPRYDGALSEFIRGLARPHADLWRTAHGIKGQGRVYADRFLSFPVQPQQHFLHGVIRYVERNPVRAGLVRMPGEWRWGSCWLWEYQAGAGELVRKTHESRSLRDRLGKTLLAPWPANRPIDFKRDRGIDWTLFVNHTDEDLEVIRRCVLRGRPYGDESWIQETAARLGLTSTLRPRGRPRGKMER